MIHLLAYTRPGDEFSISDAINDMGALAIAPRKITVTDATKQKPAHYRHTPFLPGFLFLQLDETLWHRIKTQHKRNIIRTRDGKILPPPHVREIILPRTWGGIIDFDQRAEMACDRRIEQFESGAKVARYKRGDLIRIMGDMLDGQLKDQTATFMFLSSDGMIEAQAHGVTMFGKPIKVRLHPSQVEPLATLA